MAETLRLNNVKVLTPKDQTLKKLFTFVPTDHAEKLRAAIFSAGGGKIGHYSECSFNSAGVGTFKGDMTTDPYVGKRGEQHQETETKLEIVFPIWLEKEIIIALKDAHPYEEVAYDIISLTNSHPNIGAGIIGDLPDQMAEEHFLDFLRKIFNLKMVRHTRLLNKPVKKVALCGGAGSFLISKALNSGADAYVTADIKYHEFFESNNRLLIADIGHFESEQFTISFLQEVLAQKFPTFAVQKTEVETNPVQYFI